MAFLSLSCYIWCPCCDAYLGGIVDVSCPYCKFTPPIPEDSDEEE